MGSQILLVGISYLVISAGIGVGIWVGSLEYAIFSALALVGVTLVNYQPRLTVPLAFIRSVDNILILLSYLIIIAGIATGIALEHRLYAVFSALMLVGATLAFQRGDIVFGMLRDPQALLTGLGWGVILLGIAVGIAVGNAAYAALCALLFAGVSLAFARDRFNYPLALFRSVEGLLVVGSYLVIIGGIVLGVATDHVLYAAFCALLLVGVSAIYYRAELLYPLRVIGALRASLDPTASHASPTATSAWYAAYQRALADLRDHDIAAALHHCNESIQLNPNFYAAYHTRALLYLERNQPAELVSDCTRALHLNPTFAPAWLLRGTGLLRLGRLDDAISDWQRVLSLDGTRRTQINTQMQLAAAYTEAERPDAALRACTEVIALDPDHVGAHQQRGKLHQQRGDLGAALADFSRAVDLAPGLAEGYLLRGHVLIVQGQYDEALNDFMEAESIDPDDNRALAGQAVAYHLLGERDAARSTWDILLATDPAYRSADQLAAQYGPQDRFVRAARALIDDLHADESAD